MKNPLENVRRAWMTGVKSCCPICCAKAISEFKVGQKVRFVGGFFAGHYATCVQELDIETGDFSVRTDFMDFEESAACNISKDRFLFYPVFEAPYWHPDIAMVDFEVIEAAVLEILVKTDLLDSVDDSSIFDIVYIIWRKRLPIAPRQIVDIAIAHGARRKHLNEFEQKLDFGMSCQVYLNGRRPVMRKKVKAMTVGRYLTKSEREIRISHGLPFA